jgi:hypothetical protein
VGKVDQQLRISDRIVRNLDCVQRDVCFHRESPRQTIAGEKVQVLAGELSPSDFAVGFKHDCFSFTICVMETLSPLPIGSSTEVPTAREISIASIDRYID